MTKNEHIVEILKVIDTIFSDALSLQKKYFKRINSLASNKLKSIESLNLYQSYVSKKDLLTEACKRIGLNFHVTETENIKTNLLSLKQLLNSIIESDNANNTVETHLANPDNYKAFFKDILSRFSPQIMINLQDEAEHDTTYLVKLLEKGVGLFRVNCAFGNHQSWENISNNLAKSKKISNKNGQLLFDLAGSKIRVKKLPNNIEHQLQTNSKFILANTGFFKSNITKEQGELYTIVSTWGGVFSTCNKGEIIRFDDSKIIAQIEEVYEDYIIGRVKSISSNYAQLNIGKGINLPESNLPATGLTAKDKDDLAFIIKHGDIVSFSFTKTSQDIDCFYNEIKNHTKTLPPVVIKIETCKAVENIYEILLAAMQFPIVAILVARGDLVSECGWKNLPQIQEKIYEYSRAAHLPNILATEILETFNSQGNPLRSEIIDLYHAKKFDCILLNKGAHIFDVIDFVKS